MAIWWTFFKFMVYLPLSYFVWIHEHYIMKLSPQCMPEKSKIFLADGHSPYHSRYIQTSPCKHVRSVYSRLALLIAYVHYIIFPPQNIWRFTEFLQSITTFVHFLFTINSLDFLSNLVHNVNCCGDTTTWVLLIITPFLIWKSLERMSAYIPSGLFFFVHQRSKPGVFLFSFVW